MTILCLFQCSLCFPVQCLEHSISTGWMIKWVIELIVLEIQTKDLHVESKVWHKWTYLWNRNRLTDIENRLVVAKGEGGGGGMDWEVGISRCKLLYIGWINNKALLYSTGNYIQYPVINHNGKEYEKEYIYVHWVTLLYSRN